MLTERQVEIGNRRGDNLSHRGTHETTPRKPKDQQVDDPTDVTSVAELAADRVRSPHKNKFQNPIGGSPNQKSKWEPTLRAPRMEISTEKTGVAAMLK